jgi:copper resistance protein B
MDHSQMDHSQMDHSQMDHSQMDHSQMDHSQPAGQRAREPIPPITDADLAAAFPSLRTHHVHESGPVAYVLVDRLEGWNRDSGSGQAWEVDSWFGGDIQRLRLRSEGERAAGRTHAANVDLLYSRAVSPWWDVVVGLRQDFAPGPSLTRGAIGLKGMAPYKFEIDATLYVGGDSDAALALEAEYTLLLTHRWILQPRLEAQFAAGDDPRRLTGAGLDSVSAGLRLRYEFTRRFGPYLGWEHERRFGNSADFTRAAGEHARETRFVAGLRFWF